MEVAVENVFTDEIIKEGAECFGVIAGKQVGDFENYLYEARDCNGQKYVLRFTHSSHRTFAQMDAELSFLEYVGSRGARVARPHRSRDGNLVEEAAAADGTVFFMALFEFAPGERVQEGDATVWNEQLFYTWGKTIGALHRITMDYPKTKVRPDWQENEWNIVHSMEEVEIREIAQEITADIQKLPRTKATFGLVHGDIHHGNFHYMDGNITVFDFDDAMYHYFIHDIAIVLYYSLLRQERTEAERAAFARMQLAALRNGYETEHRLEDMWYESIPLFMRMRDLTLYGTLCKKFAGKEMPDVFKKMAASIHKRILARKSSMEL
ncbi:phosphotransferase enzyme family protein [Aneurinibacillus sp. REN35]|uniref:phosphotransferase enzyme family protein n=1 Tax=Aneurinibacillus sp. REN35 TaxID=3237286 RepID=UPI003529C419